MDRVRWLAEKRDEIEKLQGLRVSEVTPSRRDFRLYLATQRTELAIVALLQRGHGERQWPDLDLVAFAAACDDAEVAALAVATDHQRGGSLELLQAIAAPVTAPVLRDDLVLHPNQLYDTRLHGGDAAILPAAEMAPDDLAELVRVASSLHMAAIIEVQSDRDLAAALALPKTVIGIRADPIATRRLAAAIPSGRVVVALRDPESMAEAHSLRGQVDAVLVSALLLDSADLVGTLAALRV